MISQDGKSLEEPVVTTASNDPAPLGLQPGLGAQRARSQSSKKTVYTYEVDFARHDVAKRVRKETFRLKPWEYLTAASDGKLPLEIQAAFQAARPVLESLRQTRMNVTRSMTKGHKTWRTMYSRLTDYLHSLYPMRNRITFDSIYIRYCRYCINEIRKVQWRLRTFLGALPSEIEGWEHSSKPVRPTEIFSWASKHNFDHRS